MNKGKIASKGYAIGKVLCLTKTTPQIEKERTRSLQEEGHFLEEAVKTSVEALLKLRAYNESRLDNEHLEIFDAHIEMVKDIEILNQTKAMIEHDNVSAAFAYRKVTDQFIAIFEAMDDAYFKARASDIKDIQSRMLNVLTGNTEQEVALVEEDTIIVAHDLTPSDTASFNYDYIKGLITEVGGTTSHSAIMARAFNIPALVGASGALSSLNDGDMVILDGDKNDVIINPSDEVLHLALKKQAAFKEKRAALKAFKTKKTVTKDNHAIHLKANIGSPLDLKAVEAAGAEGIGLFRTEFMFMDKPKSPSLDEQIDAYSAVFKAVESVVVRTLDIGGDKTLDYMDLPKEDNPFLGKRAIRLCFDESELFKTQLKALLMAGVHTKELMIMFPMIARKDELLKAKGILNEVIAELEAENISYQKALKVGIMIEIPAAALNIRDLAGEVDFFSIGTNDLMQYMYASDRMNASVSYLYEPFEPTFLRLIKHIIDEAHAMKTHVSVCGELAGDLTAAKILVGLGIDALSMSAGAILEIREALSHTSLKSLKEVAQHVITLNTFDEVKDYLNH